MKNSNLIRLMMVVGSFTLVTGSVYAEEPSASPQGQGVEKRVERQEKRIEHKLKKGKITQAQAEELKQKVENVEVKRDEMKKEGKGKITPAQRNELKQELNETSKEIKAAGKNNSAAPAASVAPVQK